MTDFPLTFLSSFHLDLSRPRSKIQQLLEDHRKVYLDKFKQCINTIFTDLSSKEVNGSEKVTSSKSQGFLLLQVTREMKMNMSDEKGKNEIEKHRSF